MDLKGFVSKTVRKVLEAKPGTKESTSQVQLDGSLDYIAPLSEDRTTLTLPDGSEKTALITGRPTGTEMAIKINSDTYLSVNQFRPSVQISGGGKGFIIIKDPFQVPLLLHKYYLVDVNKPAIQYEIDAYALAGLPAATAESGDRVKFIGFSNKANHILVGGVIENEDRENPLTLKWCVLKKFSVNGNPSNPILSFTAEPGSYEIENDNFALATDPGIPGPLTRTLNYHREQTGTGPDPVCPWNEPEGQPGATLHVSSYEEDIEWEFERTTDPGWMELEDPGPDLNIIDYTYSFSENAAGAPVVDFLFSFTSTYRKFAIYQLKRKTTEVNFTTITKQYEEGCENFCTTTQTKERITEETYSHGPLGFAVKTAKEYTSTPCMGYNLAGNWVRQTRDLFSSAETTLNCQRIGIGSGEFCFNAEGTCLDPEVADAPLTCPEGWPTCIFPFENECPLDPYPNYLVEAGLGCDYDELPLTPGVMNQDSMNYSMLEKLSKGLVALSNLNTGFVTIEQSETASKENSSLLIDVSTSRGPCNQPVEAPTGWPPMVATSGSITMTYWDRLTVEGTETGIRYSVMNKKGFKDPATGSSAAIYINTDTGNAIWFSPYLTPVADMGPVVDAAKIAVSNEVYTNDGFAADTDPSLLSVPYFVFATKARVFRNFRAGPNFPKIKLRNWSFTVDDVFKKLDLVEGEWNNQAFILHDFILKT